MNRKTKCHYIFLSVGDNVLVVKNDTKSDIVTEKVTWINLAHFAIILTTCFPFSLTILRSGRKYELRSDSRDSWTFVQNKIKLLRHATRVFNIQEYIRNKLLRI